MTYVTQPPLVPSPGLDASELYEAAQPQLDALYAALNDVATSLDLGAPHTPAPPRWALRVLGDLLNVPERAALTDDDYAYCLRLRAVANQPGGAHPKMAALAAAAAPDGTHASISMDVYFYLPGAAQLPQAQQDCLLAEIRRALTDVAGFEVITYPEDADCIFTLDDGPGFDAGCLAGTL